MEPLTAATTFATLVSLLADFVAHRGANESKDLDSFTSWLAEQRHDELRALIQSSSTTAISIKALLNDSRETILERLSSLDRTLAAVAAGMDSYRDIAQAAYPEATLSAQALSLLDHFYDSGASAILESMYYGGEIVLNTLDGPGNSQLTYSEPRYIKDDLETLVEYGFLGLDFNGKGQRMFKFKRTAAAFVEQRRKA